MARCGRSERYLTASSGATALHGPKIGIWSARAAASCHSSKLASSTFFGQNGIGEKWAAARSGERFPPRRDHDRVRLRRLPQGECIRVRPSAGRGQQLPEATLVNGREDAVIARANLSPEAKQL